MDNKDGSHTLWSVGMILILRYVLSLWVGRENCLEKNIVLSVFTKTHQRELKFAIQHTQYSTLKYVFEGTSQIDMTGHTASVLNVICPCSVNKQKLILKTILAVLWRINRSSTRIHILINRFLSLNMCPWNLCPKYAFS